MSTWAEVSDCKRGVADLLRRAAMHLERPGVDLDDLSEAMAATTAAKLALTGCIPQAAMLHGQAKRPDFQKLRAEGVAV